MNINYLKSIIVYYFALIYIRNTPFFMESPYIYVLTILPMFVILILSYKFFLKKQYSIMNILYIYFIIVLLINIVRFNIDTILNISQLFFVIYFIFNYDDLNIDHNFINSLFFTSIFLSLIGYYLKLQPYGIFPFQGYEYLVSKSWRVNLFWGSSISRTGAFSLLVFIINFYTTKKNSFNYISIILSIYFMVFSASKTALLILIFIISIYIIKKVMKINILYSLFPIILIILVIFSTSIIASLVLATQNVFLIELLNINPNHNFQRARFWLWETHLDIFKNNIFFGKGEFNISLLYKDALAASESKITYILARDGIWGILFVLFFIYLIYFSTKQNNYKAYIISSSIFILMFFYGSYINGYDFIFVSYLSYLKAAYK